MSAKIFQFTAVSMITNHLVGGHYYLTQMKHWRDMTFFPIFFIICMVKYNFQHNSKHFRGIFRTHSQLAFTYSKPTIETLEEGV